ncbi:hypothetical protein ECC02_012117 [Trypanosoma cruzi]|uniref:ATPase n=1 Tax=Trypanosoma cruzi TaxID=5693 RepID=A0A7J6XLY8_TRYCR|nr:hypothetical protein ECC02_012117 [Trypanosoma cruzi]
MLFFFFKNIFPLFQFFFVFFLNTQFFFFLRHHSLFFAFGAITMDVFFFSTLHSLIVYCCTLPVRGAVCFPPNCSTRTPTDTLMTTALCASPAARMRRGRDERRAEGAVTCGRATRSCGAEHTFLSLLFCFLAARAGRHPQRHTHTATPCHRVFFFAALTLPVERRDRRHVCVLLSVPPHTSDCALRAALTHADEKAEGSTNTQMTHEI